MSLDVTRVAGTGDLEDFLLLPHRLYADDPNWVAPLLTEQRDFFDPKHNPFHGHAETALWLARRDGRVVGRVGACIDSYHEEPDGTKVGFFGFFESENEAGIPPALFAVARDWLRDHGAEVMRGPGCFTTNHDYLGLQVSGEWSHPVVGMPYNPPWYQEHFESFGLAKAKDLWAWRIETGARIPDKIQALIDNLIAGKTFTVRSFDMKHFAEDASLVRGLYNKCWSRNWGFIPLDDDEFAYIAKDMKSMVDPDFLLVAEADGEPIGFCMTIPDFNQALAPCGGRLFPFGWLKFLLRKRKISYARTLLMGVLPEHRRKGVDVVMVYKTMQAGFAKGITRGECSWILEDNRAMNAILRGYGAELYKTYRLYDLPLT